MNYLYRGVCEEKHEANGGRLIPAGNNMEIVMQRNDYTRLSDESKFLRDGTFVRIPSEVNTARGHQLDSGIHGGCMISTTESYQIAVLFATNEGTVNGVIYKLDKAKFQSYGIRSHKFICPRFPDEKEVSICAEDGGEIPQEVIVTVRKVLASEFKPETFLSLKIRKIRQVYKHCMRRSNITLALLILIGGLVVEYPPQAEAQDNHDKLEEELTTTDTIIRDIKENGPREIQCFPDSTIRETVLTFVIASRNNGSISDSSEIEQTSISALQGQAKILGGGCN
ncbi:MAG: hypothetical protein GJU73_07020 [Ferrovum sp.]|jgi:hypothetical protein|uniref:hypothetical protein n=1 Tax=Ferrovum sp. TaxID=2609467 RepID=UPI00262C9FCC|nr:hypothetical protein [Ferrovum sp.]MBW8067181.1 hypothetical protein [Ferrovum sp.]